MKKAVIFCLLVSSTAAAQENMCFGSYPQAEEQTTCNTYMKHTFFKYLTPQQIKETPETDFIATNNVQYYAEEYIWPLALDNDSGNYYSYPCGGGADCIAPCQDYPICYVSVTDGSDHCYNPLVVSVYNLRCSGTVSCRAEGRRPEECCKVINGPKTNMCLEACVA